MGLQDTNNKYYVIYYWYYKILYVKILKRVNILGWKGKLKRDKYYDKSGKYNFKTIIK